MSANNIVIVMLQPSVIVNGIQRKLETFGYGAEVLELEYGYKDILNRKPSLFIIYLPSEVTDEDLKRSDLINFCEDVKAEEQRMIVIGEKKYRDDVIAAIPAINAYTWLDRPLELDSFGDIVELVISREPLALLKKRILIVDDDPAYAKMAREWLMDDYRVDLVTSGMQALQFLIKQPKYEQIDLILLDYEMPVVDGPQVFAMLRTEPSTKRIPIIFLTGVGGREEVRRVMELKPDGYILKSATREDILSYLKAKIK